MLSFACSLTPAPLFKDLIERLRKELSGDFRQAVEWSFYDRAHVNAAALKKAIEGAGTDEDMLVDVLCTASNHEVMQIKEAYQEREFLKASTHKTLATYTLF